MSERDLFIAVLKITDPGERSAWLDRECGGDAALRQRIDLPDIAGRSSEGQVDLLALDDALKALEQQQPDRAAIVKLRFFAGCSLEETAQALGISRATAQRNWAYARAWLFGQLNK